MRPWGRQSTEPIKPSLLLLPDESNAGAGSAGDVVSSDVLIVQAFRLGLSCMSISELARTEFFGGWADTRLAQAGVGAEVPSGR